MAVTLAAATAPRLQGLLLTAEALGVFIAAMALFPRIRLTPGEAGLGAGTLPAPAVPSAPPSV